ncbi:hypothetical protein D3C87_1840160 [compost metagenome]
MRETYPAGKELFLLTVDCDKPKMAFILRFLMGVQVLLKFSVILSFDRLTSFSRPLSYPTDPAY